MSAGNRSIFGLDLFSYVLSRNIRQHGVYFEQTGYCIPLSGRNLPEKVVLFVYAVEDILSRLFLCAGVRMEIGSFAARTPRGE